MNKLIAITLVALTLAFVNCKDKSTDTDPTPAKTLNKSYFTNKYWKCTSPPLSYYFRSDGKLCYPDGVTVDGTWKWLNNSDSLETDESIIGKIVWHAEYCTETEMKMRMSNDKYGYVFTKQ